jgi:hypothetical protein
MHTPALYTVSAPDLGSLAAMGARFAEGDLAYVQGKGALVYRDAILPVPPIGSLEVGAGTWVPQASTTAIAVANYEIHLPAVAMQTTYRLPIGNYVAAFPGEMQVLLNGVELQLGTEWMYFFAGMFTGCHHIPPLPYPQPPAFPQPSSVQDVASGFASLTGQYAPGDIITIRWIERACSIKPATASPTFFTGFPVAPDRSVLWQSRDPAATPNGIIVPPGPDGFVPEIWRYTKHRGGRRRTGSSPKNFYGDGARLVPYFRGPQLNTTDPNGICFVAGGFGGLTGAKNRYRVCYYSPTLRARSEFSDDLIVFLTNTAKVTLPIAPAGDRHNNASPNAFRCTGTLWTVPG